MQLTTQNDKKVYSDGDTVEQRMLEIARKYPEDQAEEYIAQNYDYTTNNTFSSVRKLVSVCPEFYGSGNWRWNGRNDGIVMR